MRTPIAALLSFLCSPALAAPAPEWATSDLRAGIIGTDTSHVPAFTGLLHRHPEWRIRVVAAFRAGSPDLPASAIGDPHRRLEPPPDKAPARATARKGAPSAASTTRAGCAPARPD